ncbi:MAG: isocitrate/isopropylmalate dehydrogenase family protein [Gemmatimonadetes bacterium]|nr:isocitrate/isopropylmalate dehydrogenase family protein [Gemmatimonadota bacterium]
MHIAVIGGDGIGPEVVAAALPAIETAAKGSGAAIAWEHLPYGADHYLKTGETLPDSAFRHLQHEVDAILVGALGDPRVPDQRHARDILLGLRFRLDLYINFRPCVLLHPDLCPLKSADRRIGGSADHGSRQLDFVIFRENTEGLYLARGSSKNVGTPEEEQVAEDVHTAPKVTRIIRAAFEWARAHGKTRVTMADKSNAIPAHHIWQRIFALVGQEFSDISRDHYYIDALAMQLVKRPEEFQVIVTNNMFGDIISDLGAQLVGGLGLAPSANLHPGRAGLFEPVHGSAPKYAGQGTANPMATVLTGALMLSELELPDAARRLEDAVRQALKEGVRTPDLGGTAKTSEVGAWIERRVSG